MSLRAIRGSGEGGAVETGSLDTSSFVAHACGWVDHGGGLREASDEGYGVFRLEARTREIL